MILTPRIKNLLLAFGLISVVVALGLLDDCYQEYSYGADGIAYFDMTRSICNGDWALALNPYWSIGYPLLLAAARLIFDTGWSDEWTSIRVVNLVTYVGVYASFLFFLRVAAAFTTAASGGVERTSNNKALLVVGTLIFLLWHLQGGIISQTTPDLMVCGLFLLLMSAALQFCLRPSVGYAVLMGFFAGLGFVSKAFFLPLTIIVFAVVLLRIFTQPGINGRSAIAKFGWTFPVLGLLTIPYVVGMSMVLGRFTLGESGPLNYAWTVNKLSHWRWSGGPASLGEPLHPVRMVCESPHVYEFSEPIHVTYPIFFNPFYWYEGYHHFFNLGNQIDAIQTNGNVLAILFFDTPHSPVKLLGALALVVVAIFLFTDAKAFWARLAAIWPLYIPALLGLGLYLLVWVEERYVFGFLIVLMITPLLVLFVPTALVSKRVGDVVLILTALVSLAFVTLHATPLAERALRHESFTNDADWRLGLYLAANGPPPGAKVAMVRVEHGLQTTWAYVSGLHVVSQIGNQDFNDDQQQKDFDLFIQHPEVQQNVFDLFRKAGAVMVVATQVPGAPQGDGWVAVPGAQAWVHPL